MTILIIALTMCFDWGLGKLLSNYTNRQKARDEELFVFKLQQLLKEKDYNEAMQMCRDTEGKVSYGAYLTLDAIPKLEIKIKSLFQQKLDEKLNN